MHTILETHISRCRNHHWVSCRGSEELASGMPKVSLCSWKIAYRAWAHAVTRPLGSVCTRCRHTSAGLNTVTFLSLSIPSSRNLRPKQDAKLRCRDNCVTLRLSTCQECRSVCFHRARSPTGRAIFQRHCPASCFVAVLPGIAVFGECSAGCAGTQCAMCEHWALLENNRHPGSRELLDEPLCGFRLILCREQGVEEAVFADPAAA